MLKYSGISMRTQAAISALQRKIPAYNQLHNQIVYVQHSVVYNGP